MTYLIEKLAAFSDGNAGGNPAGVVIVDELPDAKTMSEIAAQVGYSETVFTAQKGGKWRTRYFSPESEVPFCGHATIALGAALARREGEGTFQLTLNDTEISVTGRREGEGFAAALQSPLTQSEPASPDLVSRSLKMFGYAQEDLDPRIPPGFAQAGATHIVIALKSRKLLAQMSYDLNAGRRLMNKARLVTIAFVYAESAQKFHVRNAFASGGVLEDPATGAAAAAFSGYLRDLNWPHGCEIDIVQGEDMGQRSLIKTEFSNTPSSSIRVSGLVRIIDGD